MPNIDAYIRNYRVHTHTHLPTLSLLPKPRLLPTHALLPYTLPLPVMIDFVTEDAESGDDNDDNTDDNGDDSTSSNRNRNIDGGVDLSSIFRHLGIQNRAIQNIIDEDFDPHDEVYNISLLTCVRTPESSNHKKRKGYLADLIEYITNQKVKRILRISLLDMSKRAFDVIMKDSTSTIENEIMNPTFTLEVVLKNYKDRLHHLTNLRILLNVNDMFDNEIVSQVSENSDEYGVEDMYKLRKNMCALWTYTKQCYDLLVNCIQSRSCMCSNGENDNVYLQEFEQMHHPVVQLYFDLLHNDRKITSWTHCIMKICMELHVQNFRNIGEDLYKVTKRESNNTNTYFWEKVTTIREFVQTVTSKKFFFDQWLLASNFDMDKITKYFLENREEELEKLEKDRYHISVADGVYNILDDIFTPSNEEVTTLDGKGCINYFNDQYLADIGDIGKVFLDDDMSEMDENSMDEGDCNDDDEILGSIEQLLYDENLATHSIDSIFISQNLMYTLDKFKQMDMKGKRDMCICMMVIYGLLGRLLYDMGDYMGEAWQIIPFFRGVAQSGKSTIAKLFSMIYPADEVAVMGSGNMEKRFGLQSIIGKSVWICSEVKKNFALGLAEFQTIVSGEVVSVPIKFGVAKCVEWKQPGLLAGNEPAESWVDSSGALMRRIVHIEFSNCPREINTRLEEGAESEICLFIVKINRCYRQLVKYMGTHDFFYNDKIRGPLIGERMFQFRTSLEAMLDPVSTFIRETFEKASYGGQQPDGIVKKDILISKYKEYCESNKIRCGQVHIYMFSTACQKVHGAKIITIEPYGTCAIGMKLKDEEGDNNEIYGQSQME